jgi:hypothetical protein
LAIPACLFYLSPVCRFALGPDPGQQRLSAKPEDVTKSLANPYFLLMKQGYEYAQKKLGVEVVFGSTPTEEADVRWLFIAWSEKQPGATCKLLGWINRAIARNRQVYRRVSGRSLSPTLAASRRCRSSKEARIFASNNNAAAT